MKIKIWNTLACAVFAACATLLTHGTEDPQFFESETILSTMKRVNNYAVENPWKPVDRNWIRGTLYSGITEAYHATGDDYYLELAKAWAEKHQYQIGEERSGFNRLFCSMTWMELNLLEPDPKKLQSTIDGLEEDLPYSPEVGKVWFAHAPNNTKLKSSYADGLYSSCVFVMLYNATGDPKYLDWLHDGFWTVTDTILDKEDHLYYRDGHYIGQESPSGKKLLWSRGNGWVFAGLPRVLKHLPKNDPNYERYVDHYKRMAKAIAIRQQDNGFWRSNLGDSQHYLMPESSGTAFFVAGFGWGIREGILDKETYLPVVVRAWDALMSSVHPDGMMGWVQPVDAKPRPSHPRSTQEYGAGLFLSAASQVYLMVEEGLITPEVVRTALPKQSRILPPTALVESEFEEHNHPAAVQMNDFLKRQSKAKIETTGFSKKDYLQVIADQVEVMQTYQDEDGRIIDSVDHKEMYFTTPCYAHSVAALAKAGYPIGDELIESGMQALDISLKDMAENTGRPHSDFFTWPIVLAMESFADVASDERKAEWKRLLGQFDHTKYSRYKAPIEDSDHRGFYETYNGSIPNNWNLVNVAGEWTRTRHVEGNPEYVDYWLTMQTKRFTEFGMFNEHGNPLPYDLFSRHYLTGMLELGYDSYVYTTYRDILWRGAWTSLFMQSPFGEMPTGYRSSHHIWNEAQQAVIFEIYASAYAKAGKSAEAGAFKRAASLSLESIRNWIRPDGTGYVVKNRYPIDAKHGYERYTKHSCYNMLAFSMLAQAWQFADDSVEERPAPADVGGFVLPVTRHFHKVFANAAGNYVEYDTTGDHKYNPTGILRIHLKDGHPQLGPSDGASSYFGGEGVNLAVGPSWKTEDGGWHRLADSTAKPDVKILKQSKNKVSFQVIYPDVTQTITVNNKGVTIEDDVTAKNANAIRASFPMLVFDGKDRIDVALQDDHVKLTLNDRSVIFTVLKPSDLQLKRSGKELNHRNGVVEEIIAESSGRSMTYRISSE